ncbi:hypothetical protein FHR38_001212 [Micromonospora polyrhachis]|uniref:Uncharacterized protein n=1 Tax=Micromonospora polyrhachis TaxID=1282883 RepID=A0A7W7SME8_9ACTN|nr:hypothetical protein [Micromonospora polyrhachis]
MIPTWIQVLVALLTNADVRLQQVAPWGATLPGDPPTGDGEGAAVVRGGVGAGFGRADAVCGGEHQVGAVERATATHGERGHEGELALGGSGAADDEWSGRILPVWRMSVRRGWSCLR